MKKLVTAACLVSALCAAAPGGASADDYTLPPGHYCKSLSKKKIEGQKKTPYAQCVSAMAQMEKKASLKPATACAGLKKDAKGSAGKKAATKAFNQCVAAGKQLDADQS